MVLFLILSTFFGYEPAFAASVIREIRIEGNTRVDTTSILRSLALEVGDPLDRSLVTRSIKDLYRMGVFSRVSIEAEDADEGIALIIRVREFPMIRQITISGNKAIQEQELKKVLSMKTFSFFDPGKLEGEIESIKVVYRSSGYHDTVVTHVLEETDKGVNLTYRITEPEKAPVLEIDIIGNRELDDSRVKRVMQLKEKGPLAFISGGGGYDELLVADDVKRIQFLYMENGYLDITIEDPVVKMHPDGEGMYVSVKVQEGPQYVLGEKVFSGDWEGPPDFARSEPEVGIGDVFARSKVLSDIRMYEDSYRDQGYAWVRIEPRFSRDIEAGTISLEMVLQRGPLVHVRWINIAGNFKTREYVIRREMRLMESELFSQKKLDDSQKFIRALGFFESVDIELSDAGEGFADINVRVKEGSAGSLSAGVAYSSVSGLVGTLKLSLGNFAGRGQRLNLNVESGSETSAYSVSFTEPRLFSGNYSFGLDLFDRVNEYTTYTQSSAGAAVRLGYRISDATSISIRYRYVDYDVYDIDLDASQIILEQEGKSTTSSIRLGYRYDTRDFPMDPRTGEDLRLYGELAGGALGGTNDFVRFIVEGSLFRPILGDLIGLAHAEAGIINSYNGKEIPVTERFFMGGLYTLRGFEYRKVGPLEDDEPVGGAKSLLLNMEATYPLIRDANIKGVLFLDAGNVWADGENMDLGGLRYGAGFGFRWAAPIGLLRLEWGFNLDPRPDEDQPGWEFSIGALF
jgi:outer membrane protein insertion porin family